MQRKDFHYTRGENCLFHSHIYHSTNSNQRLDSLEDQDKTVL